MPTLVLFDIDETMVSSHGCGRRAIERALTTVFSQTISLEGHSLSGKTDPQICFEVLSAHGYSREAALDMLPAIFARYLPILEEEVAHSPDFHIHKGVHELLDSLSGREDTFLGLLTGNIEPGARVKLAKPDLNRYFHFGAFGSDAHDRMDLPAIAHQRAALHFKQQFVPGDLVIIGDARNDVLCAQGYGAKSIAVCTGKTERKTLADLAPDYLLDDLANTLQVVDAIFAK